MPDARREGMTACKKCGHDAEAHRYIHYSGTGSDIARCRCTLEPADIYRAALAASQQEVERLTRDWDVVREKHDALLAENTALRAELAAAREDGARLREQLRLANIDAANNEAEASDLRAERAGDRPLARGTVYGWAAGQMSIVGDPSVPLGEIQIRDDDGRVLMRIVGFDTARSTDAADRGEQK